jgi:putative MATE family efflux protein
MAHTKTSKNGDLLSGALLPKILLFSLPLMATGVLQLLFNTADTMVVGRWGGDTTEECEIALAAVGSCGSLISLIINFFMGLAVGTGVCAAQSIGAKRDDQVEQVVHTSVIVALVMGSFVAIIGFAFARPLLALMGTDPSVLDQAAPYMQAYFVGAPAAMLYNYCAAVLRSKGDTSRPLFFLTVAGVSNVALNLVMVLVFRMGAIGVGVATAASNWISCIMIVVHMMRLEDACRIDLKKLKVDRLTLSKILFIGVPAGIQSTVFAFSNVIIQSSVNSFGKATVAANAAAGNIDGYAYTVQNSIYQAAMTFVGQCVGAKRYDRLRPIVLTCVATVTAAGLICSSMLVFFGEELLAIFSPSNPEVIRIGMIRLRYLCLPYFLCGVMEVGSGILRGLGKSITSMIISISGVCGIRLVWIFTVFATFRSLEILYLSYLVCWIVTSIAHYTVAFLTIKKLKREALQPQKNFVIQ